MTSPTTRPARTCGPCTACCIAPGIEPLNKPVGERCIHLGPTGCAVYDQRPHDPKFQNCITFKCLWLQNWSEDEDRPDKLGVVFGSIDEPDAPGKIRITVTEISPGNANAPRVQFMIAKCLEQGLNVMVSNRLFSLGYTPGGAIWKFQIDPADPLHMRQDPKAPPVQITIAGKSIT